MTISEQNMRTIAGSESTSQKEHMVYRCTPAGRHAFLRHALLFSSPHSGAICPLFPVSAVCFTSVDLGAIESSSTRLERPSCTTPGRSTAAVRALRSSTEPISRTCARHRALR